MIYVLISYVKEIWFWNHYPCQCQCPQNLQIFSDGFPYPIFWYVTRAVTFIQVSDRLVIGLSVTIDNQNEFLHNIPTLTLFYLNCKCRLQMQNWYVKHFRFTAGGSSEAPPPIRGNSNYQSWFGKTAFFSVKYAPSPKILFWKRYQL